MFKFPGLYVIEGTIDTENPVSIAGFDLDSTITRNTKSKIAKDANSWAFLPNRLETLQQYADNNYIIAIFTNQLSGGTYRTTLINRLKNIHKELKHLNVWIFASVARDNYRKQNIGMWEYLESIMSNIDRSTSFFCGDAANRPQDHSDADIKFAQNLGLTFYLPEEIFPNNQLLLTKQQTLFIFVGMPASGKTHFYEKYLKNRGVVRSFDTKEIEQLLKVGKSVCIDANNPTVNERKRYIDIARNYNIATVIIYFVANGHGYNQMSENPVPEFMFEEYYRLLQEPKEEIDLVPVVELT